MPRPANESYSAWEVRPGEETHGPAIPRDQIEEDDALLMRPPTTVVPARVRETEEPAVARAGIVDDAFAWERDGPPGQAGRTATSRERPEPEDPLESLPAVTVTTRRRREPVGLPLEPSLPASSPRRRIATPVLETAATAAQEAAEEAASGTLSERLAAIGALAAPPVGATASSAGEAPTTYDLHIDDLLRLTAERKSSDLHLSEGLPPMLRIDGRLVKTEFGPLTCREIQRLVYDVLTDSQVQSYEKTNELDFSYGVADAGRFRFNLYRQRGSIAAAMRSIPSRIPTVEELRLPPILRDLTRKPSGLILVTGATGAGKSTTLAAMINVINQERDCHVMTIEDPIEYMHGHGRAMVHQRELGSDTYCFPNALRAVLREDPDVILVGEMRDLETIAAALTLAETGHLVFATLHTRNAPQTIDRIVDVFPPHQQDQIKVQLANSLEAVLAQTLLPRLGGGRVAAMEIMIANSAVRNLIREGKTEQLYSCIETGAQVSMQTMDRALVDLYRMGLIGQEVALGASLDRDNLLRLLRTR